MESTLSPEKSIFKLKGRTVCVADAGNHFFLELEEPVVLKSRTKAISLQKDNDGILRAYEVPCGKSHIKKGTHGDNSLYFPQQ